MNTGGLVFFPCRFAKCGKPWCKFLGSGTEMPLTSPGQITSLHQDCFFCKWGHKLWNVPTPGLDTLLHPDPVTARKCPVGIPKCWGNAMCPRLTCLRGVFPGSPSPLCSSLWRQVGLCSSSGCFGKLSLWALATLQGCEHGRNQTLLEITRTFFKSSQFEKRTTQPYGLRLSQEPPASQTWIPNTHQCTGPSDNQGRAPRCLRKEKGF